MQNSVIYPILRRILGYTNDQTISPFVSSHDTLRFECVYKYLGMRMFKSVMRCMPTLHNALQVD